MADMQRSRKAGSRVAGNHAQSRVKWGSASRCRCRRPVTVLAGHGAGAAAAWQGLEGQDGSQALTKQHRHAHTHPILLAPYTALSLLRMPRPITTTGGCRNSGLGGALYLNSASRASRRRSGYLRGRIGLLRMLAPLLSPRASLLPLPQYSYTMRPTSLRTALRKAAAPRPRCSSGGSSSRAFSSSSSHAGTQQASSSGRRAGLVRGSLAS